MHSANKTTVILTLPFSREYVKMFQGLLKIALAKAHVKQSSSCGPGCHNLSCNTIQCLYKDYGGINTRKKKLYGALA